MGTCNRNNTTARPSVLYSARQEGSNMVVRLTIRRLALSDVGGPLKFVVGGNGWRLSTLWCESKPQVGSTGSRD